MWKFFLLLFVLVTYSETRVCDIDITKGYYLPNGDFSYNNHIYESQQYFEEKDKICICKNDICLLKCCPHGYGYKPDTKTCLEVKKPFGPKVVDQYLRVVNENATEYFDFNFRKPNCTESEARLWIGQRYPDRKEVTDDGNLYIEAPDRIPSKILLGPDKYCIDTFIFEDKNGNRTTSFDAMGCFTEQHSTEKFYVTSTCMIISCVFILATVAVYGWLPELRNLHGRVLMAYLMCLFVGFICMATMQIKLILKDISVTSCVTVTVLSYFSLLAAFFWLNVMCFDIWWTFSGNRGMEEMSVKAKFYAYLAYAFGIPAALTIILVSLELADLPPHPLLPLIRFQGCFLADTSKLFYFYGPIVVLWVANMVFFVLTAVKIAQIKKQISVLKGKESAKHNRQSKERQRLLLFIKLFVVMGINWLLEVISDVYRVDNYIWRIVDAYNVLIGLNIFIIFVCKRKILVLLKKRYKQYRGDPLSKSQTFTRTTITRDEMALTVRNQAQTS